MKAVFAALDLVPSWVYALAVAGLVAAVGLQEVRVVSLRGEVNTVKTELAQAHQAAADERAARAEAARQWAEEKAKLQADHAAQTMRSEDAWNRKKAELEARRRADAATVAGMRDKIAAFTTRSGGTGLPDPVARERAEDRLEALGGLFREGLELVVEGRQIVERRDGEVARLLDQLDADRRACAHSPRPLGASEKIP